MPMAMANVLQDITNTVQYSSSASTRPKTLRQTSLFAFTAKSFSSSPSPVPSTSSSPPPPPPSSSDEGYSSVCFNSDGLECDEDDEADDECPYGQSSSNIKRQRLSPSYAYHEDDEQAEVDAVDAARRLRRERLLARNRGTGAALNWHDATRLREYSLNPLQSSYLSRIAGSYCSEYIDSFVSHDTRDVFRPVSTRDDRDYAPPFACEFTHASKRNGKKILAVSNEEGTVTLLDAGQREGHGQDGAAAATSFQPHNNAVFDVRWSLDDRQIATTSGDQTVVITDVETRTRTAELAVHTCSVKQVAWDPHNPNMLASASRDGSIAIWDQRIQPSKSSGGHISPVNHIRFAHATYAKSRKGKESSRSSTRSVTALAYLLHGEHLLASGGSADGTVKLWDLRRAVSRRINPPSVEESSEFTAATPVAANVVDGSGAPSSSAMSRNASGSSQGGGARSARSHGIASLSLSPDGSRLFASSTNSRIYEHDPHFLSRELSAPMHVFSAPSYASTSFYVRLSVSPDGRYLASGSSGLGYNVHVWDLHTARSRKTYGSTEEASAVLRGHRAEVGGIDWASDVLATCGDDCTVRLWRPNRAVLDERRRGESQEYKWHYSGAWEKDSQGSSASGPAGHAAAMDCD